LKDRLKDRKANLRHETAVLLLGDIHIGEVVSSEETLGLSEYNFDIFRKRLQLLSDKINSLLFDCLSGYQFDEMVIICLGDMVSGNIIDELIETNEPEVTDQVVDGAYILSQFVLEQAARFPKVRICGIAGNHGRITKRKRFKKRYANWDRIVYMMMKAILRSQDNIKFRFPKSLFDVVEINGIKFLYTHGDEIRSWMCVDEDTECLTYDGWKKYHELEKGELVLTYNMENERLEYNAIDDVFIYPDYDGPMVQVKSKMLDCLMTPNHRCPVIHYKQVNHGKPDRYIEKVPMVRRALELSWMDHILTTAQDYQGVNEIKGWSDDEVRLLGWILTEGMIITPHTGYARISQAYHANPEHCREIESIFSRLGLEVNVSRSVYRHSDSGSDSIRMDFFFHMPKKFLQLGLTKTKPFPRWILRFPRRQLRILLETMLKGDGSRGHHSTTRNVFYQKDPISLDIFQEMALKCGYTALVHYNPVCGYVHLSKSLMSGVQSYKSYVGYRGTVWCIATANRTWVARRNGKIWITGNSVPWYGVERDRRRKQELVQRLPIGKFDYMILGHFHTCVQMDTPTGEVFVNGSFVGGDEYSIGNLGRLTEPTQLLFGVSPDGIVSWRFPIRLGDVSSIDEIRYALPDEDGEGSIHV